MTRTERIICGACALIFFGFVCAAFGYGLGTRDTTELWSNVTDRCIAKLESTLVIARNR